MDTASTVRLPAQSQPVLRAAIWLREHLARPDYESIDDDFAEYFGCRVVREPLGGWDYACLDVYAEFDNESAATMFVLKWSA
jgi:hypothetical protein